MATIREDMIRMEGKLDAILDFNERSLEVQNKHEATLQEHHKRSLALETIVEVVQKDHKTLAAKVGTLDNHIESCPARQDINFKKNLFEKAKTWFLVLTSSIIVYKAMNWSFLDGLFQKIFK